jgi:hypothetical protein
MIARCCHGFLVQFEDPDIRPGIGIVARQCQPHQTTPALAHSGFACEEKMAEHGLALDMPLFGRQVEPA